MAEAVASMLRDPVLHCEGLVLERGGRVLADGLAFALASGERGLILGANGTGKSTLAAGLCGLLPLSATRLNLPARIGYAPQEPRFPESRRCGEYLAELAALGGAGRAAAPAAARALERFGLQDAAHRRIGELSRGWRQRLNLARAWLGDPPLVVLDEPQTALDPEGLDQLRRELESPGAPAALVVAPPQTGCERLAPLLHELGGAGPAP